MAGPHFDVKGGKYIDYVIPVDGNGIPTTRLIGDSVAGITTNAYVEALTITDTIRTPMGMKINVHNTHGSATMYYKIDGYVNNNVLCKPTPITVQTSIAGNGVVYDVACNSPFARVVVSVKQNSGAGTYQIDYIPW